MYGSGSADGVEALLVQCAEDLCLGFQAHVADFVEEEGSAVGALEGAAHFGGLVGAASSGVGSGAVAVAEELGFDEVFGDGGAVELDEDAVAAQGLGVHGASDEFFAGAGFAEDEHAAVGGGHELDLLAESFDGDGLAGDGAFGELARELLVIFAEVMGLDGVAKDEQGAVHGERLFEEVVGAELGGADGGFDGAVAGDHDDFGSTGAGCGVARLVAADGGEDIQTVAVGEPDVEEDGLVVGVAEEFKGFGGGAGGRDGVVLFAEDGFEGLADVGFVVDDENVVHRGSCKL